MRSGEPWAVGLAAIVAAAGLAGCRIEPAPRDEVTGGETLPEVGASGEELDALVAKEDRLRWTLIELRDARLQAEWAEGNFRVVQADEYADLLMPSTLAQLPPGKPFAEFRLIQGSDDLVRLVVLEQERFADLYARLAEWRALHQRIVEHPGIEEWLATQR